MVEFWSGKIVHLEIMVVEDEGIFEKKKKKRKSTVIPLTRIWDLLSFKREGRKGIYRERVENDEWFIHFTWRR